MTLLSVKAAACWDCDRADALSTSGVAWGYCRTLQDIYRLGDLMDHGVIAPLIGSCLKLDKASLQLVTAMSLGRLLEKELSAFAFLMQPWRTCTICPVQPLMSAVDALADASGSYFWICHCMHGTMLQAWTCTSAQLQPSAASSKKSDRCL